MPDRRIISVSELNQYVKDLLDLEPLLKDVYIRGEISNFKYHSSGHLYFTLKDEGGLVRSVMFKSDALRLRFHPQDGMKVLARGRISVFVRDGQYQLYVTELQPDGVGDLYTAFEQLKEKLLKEGLFDQAHKKPLPAYPCVIALITSPTGAAIRDMIRILGVRFPQTRLLVYPVMVQGSGAAAEIADAISCVNEKDMADLIITGRGGGSLEDLWAFNEEIVARAIYASRIPVISAVGHEPDVTIADFVADRRAATPSNAAEIAVPDQTELYLALASKQAFMRQALSKKLSMCRQRLTSDAGSRVMSSPAYYIQEKRQELDYTRQLLAGAAQKALKERKERYLRLAATLDAISPLKVLGRGYSIVLKDGRALRSYREARPKDALTVRLSEGALYCEVVKADKV